MAKVQYALVTSLTAPYHRMLKFTDGAPSVVTIAAQTTPVPLFTSEVSPDGVYFVAATANSTTQPLRIWRRTANNDFVVVVPPTLTLAAIVTDIKWLDDTHLIVVDSTNGVWAGLLDRATNTFTWQRIATDTGFQSCCLLDPPTLAGVTGGGGTTFHIGGRASSPYARYFKRTGETYTIPTGVTNGQGSVAVVGKSEFDPTTGLQIMGRPGTNVFTFFLFDPTTTTFFNPNATFPTPYGTSTAVSYTPGGFAFSPSGRHFIYSLQNDANAADNAFFLRMYVKVWTTTRPYLFYRGMAPTLVLPARANDFGFVSNDILLIAVNSNAQGTGRVRGFVHTDGAEDLGAELMDVAALFNDWNAIPTSIAVGPPVLTGSVAYVYDSAIDSMLNDTIHLSNIKLALVGGAAPFNAAHTTLAQALNSAEVYSGPSWPQGGIACGTGSYLKVGSGSDTSFLLPIPSTDYFEAPNMVFRAAVIYDAGVAGGKPIAYIDFGVDQTAFQYDRLQFSAGGNRLLTFKSSN